MNPWDNFLLAVKLTWPVILTSYAILIGTLLLIRYYSTRPYNPNDDFTDERYADGFYLQREKRE